MAMHYPTRTEIEELSPEERLRLIEDVWETFEASPNLLGVSEEHREVLDQRLAELERNPTKTMSWDEMLQRPGPGDEVAASVSIRGNGRDQRNSIMV